MGEVAWRLCTAHYVSHLLALASSAAAAWHVGSSRDIESAPSPTLLRSGGYLLLTALVLALYKMAGQKMFAEAALESFLLQGQALMLVMLWPLSRPVCLWWAFIFALLHLLAPPSEPETPAGQRALQELTQRVFDEITDPALAPSGPSPTASSSSSYAADGAASAQVLVLYSHHSPQCHQHFPMINSLAQRYSGPRLKWGRVDVARFPEVGERFGVQGAALASPVNFSLPVLLLYSQGTLLARLDPFPEWHHLALPSLLRSSTSRLHQALIVKHFQLDSWLVNNHTTTKGQ